MASACRTVQEGASLQGLYDSAVLAGGRYGSQQSRAEPARLLPRREGHDLHGPVPHRARPAERTVVRRGRRRRVLHGMDDDALDAALEHGAGRGARYPLRARAVVQSLYGRSAYRLFGQRPVPGLFPEEERRPSDGRLRGRRQKRTVPCRGRVRGQGPGRHPLRAAAPVDRARRRCVPRHHRRLRDDRGRYRHRAYRADVRRRRRPGGQAERHPAAGGRRSRGQAPTDGRPHGQVLPSGGPRSRVRPHARRCGGLRRVRGAVRQECLRR